MVVLALRTQAWAHARVPVITVLVFTALTLTATLLHRDRFHFSAGGDVARFAAWFWLGVYLVIPVALTLLAVRQQRMPGDDPERRQPLPRWLAAVLTVQGAIMLVVGVGAVRRPGDGRRRCGPGRSARSPPGWSPPGWSPSASPSVLALWERDLERLEIAAVAYTLFGVLQLIALARYSDEVRWGSAAATGYLLVLISVVPTGAIGWWTSVRGRRRRAVDATPAAAARAG